MTRPFIAGLVLAAGASTRLGQPKQLLPFGGTTMLGRVVAETCAAAGLDQVVVVIGGSAAAVRRQVDFGPATVVENPEFIEGCASSYRTGLAAVDPRAQAVAVLLGDQPGLDRGVIDLVAAEWRRDQALIMLASYQQGGVEARRRPSGPGSSGAGGPAVSSRREHVGGVRSPARRRRGHRSRPTIEEVTRARVSAGGRARPRRPRRPR